MDSVIILYGSVLPPQGDCKVGEDYTFYLFIGTALSQDSTYLNKISIHFARNSK
jgi:hypothetical protein